MTSTPITVNRLVDIHDALRKDGLDPNKYCRSRYSIEQKKKEKEKEAKDLPGGGIYFPLTSYIRHSFRDLAKRDKRMNLWTVFENRSEMVGGLRHESSLGLMRATVICEKARLLKEEGKIEREEWIEMERDCTIVKRRMLKYGRMGDILEKRLLEWKKRLEIHQPDIHNIWCLGIQLYLDGVSVIRKSNVSVLGVKASVINLPRNEKNSFQYIWELTSVPDTNESFK
ncbi:hypothetical protein ADUPG1_013661, partial [Aduncisulcus paluster]